MDKTDFIREIIESRGSVNLFTRPRRFGKSLNMDMLRTFFEIGADAALFEGLAITKAKELCEQYMGKYPVISISLKDVSGMSYDSALKRLSGVIKKEARRHQYLLQSDKLTDVEKESLKPLFSTYIDESGQEESLYLLSEMLFKHHGKQVIILIDEYDVPLDKAYQKKYYLEMTEHIRIMFSEALKTNGNLYFAVITGCLRIAKESIFTGLNNFKVRSLSDIEYAEYFGFTDAEVQEMLSYYGIKDAFKNMKEWYDGYHIGHVEVYCPWDVINQCDKLRVSRDAPMEAHWENSSSNVIVQEILENATATTRAQIEALISGECVEKQLIPELTYTDLDNNDDEVRQTYLWSVLFATGYLTSVGRTENGYYKLVIPNKEVRGIYERKISSWFKVRITSDTSRWQKFCKAIKNGEPSEVQNLFNQFMSDSISIRDTCVKKDMKENLPAGKANTRSSKRQNSSACFYHGMLLGLLQAEGTWIVKSNAESGIGYTDIRLEIPQEKIGCVIEVKYAEDGKFDAACIRAMRQIDDAGYIETLRRDGMRTIHKYGIACYKKNCKVSYGSDI